MSLATDTGTPPAATGPAPDELPRKRWSTAEFDRLLAEGFLVEGDRAYLWDGEIIEPMAENPPHYLAVLNLVDLFRPLLDRATWTVFQNVPLALADGFKPQPDVMVVRGPRSAYRDRVPAPADVALLIEVADSSRARDFGPFLRKYAEAGIPRYWVVDIPGRRVEVFDDPGTTAEGEPSYRQKRAYGLDEAVRVVLGRDGYPVEYAPIAVRAILEDSLGDDSVGGLAP